MSAETDMFSHADSPSSRSFVRSGSSTSIPGFLSPTEFPKSPSDVSQITGSLLPGFGLTWKLLVVIISTSGTFFSNHLISSGFVVATPLTVAR